MRDPKRIDRILKLIREEWEQYPDLRLGQLLCNLFKDSAFENRPFYIEDTVVEEALKNRPKPIPVDEHQCQAEWQGGSFMTFGPRPWVRCEESPVVIAIEKKPDPKDGLCGRMSLCAAHRDIVESQRPGQLLYQEIRRKR